MNAFEAIKTRRSIRRYKPKPIPEDVLMKMLEAMRLAPSGGNRQPWEFIVVQDEGLRHEMMAAAGGQKAVAEAPVVIVAITPGKTPADSLDGHINIMIPLDHLTLAAVDEGLGTLWIRSFNEAEVKKVLDIPEDRVVVCVMLLGYPAGPLGPPKPRKPLRDITHWEKFGHRQDI